MAFGRSYYFRSYFELLHELLGHVRTAGWFLVADLGLDWRMAAEWFESVLTLERIICGRFADIDSI